MVHKRTGLYVTWFKYKQNIQFRRMWETPLKQTCRLNAVIYRSETELKVAKKFKTRLSNPIQIQLIRIYKMQSKSNTKLKIRRIQIHFHVHLWCATNTLRNWTWCDIFQNVRSLENHKKARKVFTYFPALKVCVVTGTHLMYSDACIRRNIRVDCFCTCELHCSRAKWILLPCLFRSSNPGVCANPGAHMQDLKTRNWQDFRAELWF